MNIITNLKYILISDQISLREAMIDLDRNGLQILLLQDSKNKITGLLTDGDIRRHIINNGSMDIPVALISNKTFITATTENELQLETLLDKHYINHIPIIDENGIVKSLATRNKKQIENKVPVVIVAGGQGTRLSPLSKIFPKALMPVGEMTMLEKIIENFYIQGFKDFRVILNHKKDLIKTYMSQIDHPYKIKFYEEEKYSNTAGGLALLKDELEGPFVVTNCDILANLSYQALIDWHSQREAELTILGVRKRIDIPYGVVNVDNKSYVTKVDEKPFFNQMIISGIYVLNPSTLKLIPEDNVFGMDELIAGLLDLNEFKVTCYPIESGWYDIGQFDEYRKLINYLGEPNA